MTARSCALLLAGLFLTGCSTLRPMADVSPAAIQQRVQPGDEVRVAVQDGREFDLEVTRVDAETLTGVEDSGKRLRIRYDAIRALEADTSAGPVRRWFGINLGIAGGDVDLPCESGSNEDCSEVGAFPVWGANVTFGGKLAVRLRAIRAEEEDTDHKPLELAVLAGPRMGRSWYALIGVGRIVNPDDEYPGHVTGLAWELLRGAPTDGDTAYEFSVFGNYLGDADFIGVGLGVRFGQMR